MITLEQLQDWKSRLALDDRLDKWIVCLRDGHRMTHTVSDKPVEYCTRCLTLFSHGFALDPPDPSLAED